MTCEYCHTSSFIQTRKRQPTQGLPSETQVIHVKGRSATPVLISAVASLVVLGVGVAVAVGGATTSLSANASSLTEEPQSPPPQLPSPSKVAPFTDPEGVGKLISVALGAEVELTELIFYDKYAIFKARDPKNPHNVDRYLVRDGNVRDPDPVRLSSREKQDLEAHLFKLQEVDLTLVPKLIQDAQARLEYANANVSHVMLKRAIPFDSDVGWRVYVSSERDSGSVSYKLDGTMQRVYE